MLFNFSFSENLLDLSGDAIQGGFLLGNISNEIAKVFFNYQEAPVWKNSFLLGFGRDETGKQVLTIVHRDGRMFTEKFMIKEREYDIQRIDKIAKKYTEQPVDANLQLRISNESKSLKAVRSYIAENDQLYAGDFQIPVIGGRFSSVFGSQRIVNGIPKSPHSGIDIAVPTGTDVKAMANGVVALTGNYFYNGKFVLLDHGLGLNSIYIHLNKIDVEIGERVKIGDMIGKVGTTGRSTGPHLHWGVYLKDKKLDPALVLDLKKFLTIKGGADESDDLKKNERSEEK